MYVRMLRKDLDCVSKIGRDAKKSVRLRMRVKLAKMQTTLDYSTHERTHNIYDCERVSTICEAEDRKIRAYLTRGYLLVFHYKTVTQYNALFLKL